jgi:hypothetical protein
MPAFVALDQIRNTAVHGLGRRLAGSSRIFVRASSREGPEICTVPRIELE